MQCKAPFTMCVAGCTKSGKTRWLIKFIENAKLMIEPPPEKIFLAYGRYQDCYDQLKGVTLIDGVPDEEMFADKIPKLLILDDLMQSYNKDDLNKLFTQGSHHSNLSVVHVVQNLFHTGLRCARINSHYLVLMKNPSDRLQAMTLSRQIFPTKQKAFIECLDDACCKPYGYLFLDLEPSSDDNQRILTNIFPDDIQIVYQFKV